ncbi:hypothetical protein HWV62_1226 [Athelia sp. TMB]|nr:hypothetical protein HWV62_5989 [Athelia sp. TMB]KAF7978226.1 hypothetical protein HWV62_1226 [Athelia sp. TMB]
MRVFITGATGFVGSAVIQELLAHGHTVLGLSRNEANAKVLAAAGADAHPGSLDDLESLRSGAASCDGTIHCGFKHDFANYQAACDTDRGAIEAIGDAYKGTGKPFIVTSGTLVLKPGTVGTEDDAGVSEGFAALRAPSETLAIGLAGRGVRSMVLRLSPSVHGPGDQGFIAGLIDVARKEGVSAYVGDGAARWPGVYLHDAARLYRLALEKGRAGACYHGVGDEGVPTKEIAEAIGKGLEMPIVSKTPEEAGPAFGFLAFVLTSDNPTSNEKTREELGWRPEGPGLIADIAAGHYFDPSITGKFAL